MKELKLNRKGELDRQEIRNLGVRYSFLEKIKKKGVGSPKVIYKNGISEFDKVSRNLESEIAFVNFELLKNGLLCHLNQNQRNSCVGIKLSDLLSIKLIGYRIKIRMKRFGRTTTKIVHRGELELIEIGGESNYSIIVMEFESLVAFFSKEEFKGKFNYSISINPPEKDNGHLMGIFDALN